MYHYPALLALFEIFKARLGDTENVRQEERTSILGRRMQGPSTQSVVRP